MSLSPGTWYDHRHTAATVFSFPSKLTDWLTDKLPAAMIKQLAPGPSTIYANGTERAATIFFLARRNYLQLQLDRKEDGVAVGGQRDCLSVLRLTIKLTAFSAANRNRFNLAGRTDHLFLLQWISSHKLWLQSHHSLIIPETPSTRATTKSPGKEVEKKWNGLEVTVESWSSSSSSELSSIAALLDDVVFRGRWWWTSSGF